MKNREEGYIGELLLSKDTELERTCLIVSQVVKKGTFSLEEALDLYQVPYEKYTKYLAGTIVDDLTIEFGGATPSFSTKRLGINLRVSLLAKIVELLFYPSILEDATDEKNVQLIQKDLQKIIKAG